MIHLLHGELLRARSRRMPHVLVAVVLASMVLAAVTVVVRGDDPIDLDGTWIDLAALSAVYAAWASAVLGASLVGAEFRSGGITQVVNWEPRRGRVVAMKLVAAATVGFACTAVPLAVSAVVLVVLDGLDLVSGIGSLGSAAAARSVAALVVVGSLAAVTGGCLAFLLRSSVGAVVAVTSSVLVVEPLLGAVVEPFAGRGPIQGLASLTGHPDSAVIAKGGDLGAVLTAAFWLVVMGALAYQAFVARDLSDSD